MNTFTPTKTFIAPKVFEQRSKYFNAQLNNKKGDHQSWIANSRKRVERQRKHMSNPDTEAFG